MTRTPAPPRIVPDWRGVRSGFDTGSIRASGRFGGGTPGSRRPCPGKSRASTYHDPLMDLAAHFRVIAQNWLRILLISIGIAILVFAASTVQSKKYQAKELLVVTPGAATSGGETLTQASSFLAQNYAKYAATPTVVRNAIRTSGMDLTLDEAKDRITASQVGELGFIEIKATGPSKQDAERLTRFSSSSLIDTIKSAQTQAKFADLQPIQNQRQQLNDQLSDPTTSVSERAAIQGQLDALTQAEIDIRGRKEDNLGIVSGAIADEGPVSPMPVRD